MKAFLFTTKSFADLTDLFNSKRNVKINEAV